MARTHVTDKRRRHVYELAGYCCQQCGDSYPPGPCGRPVVRYVSDARRPDRTPKIRMLEIDHIHPVSFGGGNEIANLQALCTLCNARKGARV